MSRTVGVGGQFKVNAGPAPPIGTRDLSAPPGSRYTWLSEPMPEGARLKGYHVSIAELLNAGGDADLQTLLMLGMEDVDGVVFSGVQVDTNSNTNAPVHLGDTPPGNDPMYVYGSDISGKRIAITLLLLSRAGVSLRGVDTSGFAWGPGGDLDGKTIEINGVSIPFNAPASLDDVINSIRAVGAIIMVDVEDDDGHVKLLSFSGIEITGGNAAGILGFSVGDSAQPLTFADLTAGDFEARVEVDRWNAVPI